MKYTIGLIAFLALSIGLGSLSKNWFLAFGLTIVVASSLLTITMAIRNALLATQAKKQAFADFLPKADNRQSHSFKFTAALMGVDVNSPWKQLQLDVKELQQVAIQDEKNFRQAIDIANHRIDICLAQIRFHEIATLPKILGQGAGLIVLSAVLAIIGSVYLAFPEACFATFSTLARSCGELAAMLHSV
ncbi:hypothetical protein [Herbaspirillum frisingense]|uniref:SLATT domain-containing protein n=1 Tax=Herbaspirillum frisingense TaxID=92645 RepID=A0ABU1PK98_9BURK|nr:hypothetical protein [Herbaspirillum frisingense]MDR6586355.1 hypothetical protein [Herbaspirillum frisingense]